MSISISHPEAVFNYNLFLNPCIGCIKRGKCEGEQYAEPDSYCRDRKTRSDKVAEELKAKGWKEIR